MENMELQTARLVEMPAKVIEPPFGMDFRTWFDYKKGLEAKKSLVRSQVKRIAKNGQNREQGYKYAEAADIYDQINDIMHDAKLGFSVDLEHDEIIRHKENGAPITKVYLKITWTDLDTGYFEQQSVVGTGLDYGDKGIYKAYTGAAKYSLVLNFLIPTGDDPARGAMDPENDKNSTPPPEPQNGPQRGASNRGGQRQGTGQQSGQNGQNSQRGEANKPKGDQQKPQQEEKPQGGQAPEGGGDPAAPVDQDTVGKMKVKLLTLAAFSDDKNKKKAEEAVLESLRVKLGVKFGQVSDLTQAQADDAMKYLDGWIKLREEKKQKQQEAAQGSEQPADNQEPNGESEGKTE